MRTAILGVSLLCLVVAGCGGGDPDGLPRGHRQEVWHSPVLSLVRYAGADGVLTRAELEAGLKRDFDAADLNHSGVLEPDEARTVNKQRWDEDKSAVSPLQDWNGDGVIDFAEFAAGPRALFNELDPNHTGVISAEILRAARGLGPEPGAPDQPQDGQDRPRGGRRGGPGGLPGG
jgi:hypothetical protein